MGKSVADVLFCTATFQWFLVHESNQFRSMLDGFRCLLRPLTLEVIVTMDNQPLHVIIVGAGECWRKQDVELKAMN